jgi:hypothetical protein
VLNAAVRGVKLIYGLEDINEESEILAYQQFCSAEQILLTHLLERGPSKL